MSTQDKVKKPPLTPNEQREWEKLIADGKPIPEKFWGRAGDFPSRPRDVEIPGARKITLYGDQKSGL